MACIGCAGIPVYGLVKEAQRGIHMSHPLNSYSIPLNTPLYNPLCNPIQGVSTMAYIRRRLRTLGIQEASGTGFPKCKGPPPEDSSF